MYSDLPPALVYPDTYEAQLDARMHDPNHEVYTGFCPMWKEDHYAPTDVFRYRKRCANRRYEGDRTHSWCHRCMVGYIMLTPEQSDLYARLGTRTEALSV